MGAVYLEVLQRQMRDRFGLEISFGDSSVLYRETIAGAVEGVGHYEPLRHYAEVHLLLEPLPNGSGIVLDTSCPEDALDRNWQRLILTHLMEKTHRGVLIGAPITDMKLTLIAGRAHLKHTEGGDFRQATYRAVRQGLRSAESVLLEPWYRFELELPRENLGRAIADVQTMGGSFEPAADDGETALLTGRAPVARLRGYQAELTAYTHGLGRLFCAPDGYAPCQNTEEVVAAVGYDADGDLENTADSVFCSHGVGVVVKWNEVREHMHIDTGWGREAPEEEDEAAQWQRRAEAYVSRLAGDEELLRIFERTYGPVKKERLARQGRASRREPSGLGYRAKPLPEGPEYLLVDGYNIIYAWDELRKIAAENLDAARERLIHLMCSYQSFRRCELIVVFDAYKVKGNHGSVEKVHNTSVVYTKEAETADMYIEKVTKEIGRRHRVRVATSDGLEQIIIIGHGALRVTASELEDEVRRVERAIRDYLDAQV
jgi:predicted RNA-binding protein with PIN domain